jgi:hypothetical protein
VNTNPVNAIINNTKYIKMLSLVVGLFIIISCDSPLSFTKLIVIFKLFNDIFYNIIIFTRRVWNERFRKNYS